MKVISLKYLNIFILFIDVEKCKIYLFPEMIALKIVLLLLEYKNFKIIIGLQADNQP